MSTFSNDRARGIFLFAIGLLSLTIWSVDSLALDDQQWRINELQVDDGLPDSTVYSLAQDQTGFLWFGTTNGLARFDGHTFKVFQHDGANEATIANNNAGNIFIDNRNQLWIGTFGGGANVMDLNNGRLTRYPYTSNRVDDMLSQNVQTFYQDHQGQIWVGTADGMYRMTEQGPRHAGELISDQTLTHERVWDITGDQQGNIWAGTSTGLMQLNPGNDVFKHHTLPKDLVFDVTSNQFRTLELQGSTLWIGSASGLFEFDLQTQQFRHHGIEQSIVKINDLLVYEDRLLIASMSGLYQFDPQRGEFTRRGEAVWQALNHLDVRAVHADPSGLLWLATRDNGVLQLDPKGGLFHHHLEYQGEMDETDKSRQIWSLSVDASNRLLIGTSQSVYRIKNHQLVGAAVTPDGQPVPGIIRDIESTSEGHWLATSEGLFWQAEGSDVVVRMNQPFQLSGVEAQDLFAISVSQAGELWLALYNIGILRWHPQSNQAELIQSHAGGSLTDLNLGHIYVDSQEQVWIASGLIGVIRYQLNTDQLDVFTNDFNDLEGLTSNRIRHITEDSSGRLWVATERGLNVFDPTTQHFKAVMNSDPVISKSIYAIAEDSQQNIWLTNQFGISRYNPLTESVNHYYLSNNYRVDGFLPRGMVIDEDDVIYIGSVNGYYSFNPADLDSSRSFQPAFVITDVSVDDRPVPFTEVISHQERYELNHQQNKIAFTMAALDFKAIDQIQFQYQLQGLHDDWLDVGNSRRIEFSQLNPGAYQLNMRAINNDGSWQPLTRQLSLVVYPVWWERSWVRAILIGAVLLLAWSIHFYRTLKIRQQNQRLEAEVSHRTAELREANAKLKAAAHSDYLTGLNNRMAFVSGFEAKHRELSQGRKNSTIVMADIDHFKLINDQYGHAAGDEVLRQVSQIMQAMIREDDLMARWGGEEFIFYFDRMDAENTERLIERIRQKIETSEISFEEQVIPVTLTFGVCQHKTGQSLNDCINAADDALYQGKKSGRNQVVVIQG
jgi:diguanylate cyclase (GGDEF)-like protein